MQAVCYSTFRNNLKSYMRRANEDAEPVLVTSSNPDDNVVMVSQRDWDALMETTRIYRNPYLLDKVSRGIAAVQSGKTTPHGLTED